LQWQLLVAGRRALICLFVKPEPGFGGIGRIDGFCWLVSFQSFFITSSSRVPIREILKKTVMTYKVYLSDGALGALVIVADTGLVANARAVW